MPKKKTTKKQRSVQEGFAELEKLVEKLDSGDLDIEEALKDFEAGLGIAGDLKKTLKKTEQSIEELKNTYDSLSE